MHTPEGFAPSHILPPVLPAGALAFAFRDTKLLVGGPDGAPVVPTLGLVESLGPGAAVHYLAGPFSRKCQQGRCREGRRRGPNVLFEPQRIAVK